MNQMQKAKRFTKLHVKGEPLILFNAWDAGSAKAIAETGAKAVATSSWSVAEAQGFSDGEEIPLPFVEQIVKQIARAVDVPVTIDFEGGYSEDSEDRCKGYGIAKGVYIPVEAAPRRGGYRRRAQ